MAPPQYLDFLSRLRPGWYFHHENWLHRLYLQIDETSRHISCFNFILNFEIEKCDFYKSCGFFNKSVDNAIKALDNYFQNFCHMEDEALLTYYLEKYDRFIIVSPNRSKMLLTNGNDKREYTIEKNRPRFVEIYRNASHLEVLWNSEDNLVVTCHLPPETCFCVEKTQKLSPIPYQFPEEYKRWTQHNGQYVLESWRDEYRLTNEQKVSGVRYLHDVV